MILRPLILITLKISSGCLRYVFDHTLFLSVSCSLVRFQPVINSLTPIFLPILLQNDKSDVLDLTFSIDADEEKLILYERTEVINISYPWMN